MRYKRYHQVYSIVISVALHIVTKNLIEIAKEICSLEKNRTYTFPN